MYRRYASLFFIAGCASTDNELITLEIVHRYVEQMDKYYGNVCELDIIFNFQKAYFILDELLLAGEMQESSKKNVLRTIGQQDSLEEMEVSLARYFTYYNLIALRYLYPTPSPILSILILAADFIPPSRLRRKSRRSCSKPYICIGNGVLGPLAPGTVSTQKYIQFIIICVICVH